MMCETRRGYQGDWLNEKQVKKAVEALQKYVFEVEAKKKTQLIPDNPFIHLVVNFKKVQKSRSAPQRILLPHPINDSNQIEVCLFTKDTKMKVKELLKVKGVDIVTKIIPISKLRTHYHTYERKRELASTYDVYLADKRIVQALYGKLGKSFIMKRGFPYLVNLSKNNLKKEFINVISSTHYRQNSSKTITIRVGRLSMSCDSVVENTIATMKRIVQKVPQGWSNIQVLHIKTTHSVALPIFNSLTLKATKLPNFMQ